MAYRNILQKLRADKDISHMLDLVERIDLSPGALTITIDPVKLVAKIKVGADEINEGVQTISAPFQLRKRGVEIKLVLADASDSTDDTLIRTIAKAHLRFEQIGAGRTLSEIANSKGTTNGRFTS
ncbi:hypothetical protein [uncultured Roseobacter sp.]|uniref:hypothetical protein n=1 Tax=uncultured Roseobacter sp. TaxID=114847 RepID=UPI002617E3DC|nr:hypothetical protein [uncultured Roseobacter sp.]